MGADEIKLDYDLAEAMAKEFRDGAKQLEETMKEMNSIAGTLEEGALLGRGGTAFVESIRGKLVPALNRLTEKFRELEGDVNTAIAAMRRADEQSRMR
jgi:WXG100 family type VII secretion target